MAGEGPSTPPRATRSAMPPSPMTPDEIRRTEIARLKAKEAWKNNPQAKEPASAGQKRPYSEISTTTRAPAPTSRDARSESAQDGAGKKAGDFLQPARNFTKYIEYDFSKMTDTKGGFLTSEDDPFNKALKEKELQATADKPAHMTLAEWERHKLLTRLREERKGPFEPGPQQLQAENKPCRECGSLDIDWKWEGVFGLAVCKECKDKLPERYSLLTKTEVKQDYLLTDSELRDAELLPHLSKPNPHKSSWNNMMLFLRCQVEEYAIEKKWGSEEALDAAFEQRQAEAKRRKSEKFRNKLQELKKRTRVEAWKRAQKGGDGGDFGDTIGGSGRHEHEWGRPEVDEETGVTTKKCIECGIECEELEF